MNKRKQRGGEIARCLLAGLAILGWWISARADDGKSTGSAAASSDQPVAKLAGNWNQKAAAAYLDGRAGWWMEWPKSARDHETFCVSCHTAVPYAISRPALRAALAEDGKSANEQRLLANVTKRVRMWKEVAPFYSDADRGAYKTVESRGTESVLNALILSSNDAQSGKLSKDTLTALESMWGEQQTSGERKGTWLWLRFANEPWEADDSGFYGATLAAIAIGSAPENYAKRPEIQDNVSILREYLNRESAAQTTINRAVLLWASAKLPGLLATEKQKAIIDELLEKEQPDGGWSLAALSGDWKRHDGTPQDMASDGYATGLITLALQQSGVSPDREPVKRGLAWLAASQDKSEGFWPSTSLNNSSAHHMAPTTVRFMNDAATAYAVLALSETQPR